MSAAAMSSPLTRPLQNRVAPNGDLVATTARGTLFGNRGARFHDPATKTVGARRWATKQWICCVLSFKNRRRDVWGRTYTELFFCDEVTALSSGHRPCFECRRADAVAFATAVMRHDGLKRPPSAPEMDERLHAERLDGKRKRVHRLDASSLPDGAMILVHDVPYAVKDGMLLHWSFEGYAKNVIALPRGIVDVLTPLMIVGALRQGFSPRWHPSAE